MHFLDGARFVGLYASFPIDKTTRRVEILEKLLALEEHLTFRKIGYGETLGKIERKPFSQPLLAKLMESLSRGAIDWLQLIPYQDGPNWKDAYNNASHIHWKSSIIEPQHRPSSPVESRFGHAGSLVITYPIARFAPDSASVFQGELLRVLSSLFVGQEMHWAFINAGLRPFRPSSLGTDDIFLQTRGGIPHTSFDSDLDAFNVFFKEFAKGAFWANFLNSFHVERLEGIRRIFQERPCEIIRSLGNGRVLLQVGPSPLESSKDESIQDYQRLRQFLRPILVETSDEVMRLQRDVMGSWQLPSPREGKLHRRNS